MAAAIKAVKSLNLGAGKRVVVLLPDGIRNYMSNGTAMAAAIKAVKSLNLGAGKRVVVLLPDGIRNYMSKFVSDQWMEAHRFMEPPQHTMR
ncbi:hypothetical protein PYW07_007883 [Mythimna separata]|uniref:Uncharacterized protein n=1 Tax=Mythimna separata TaxID=271217 RepID=A0AAD8DUE0_MYTSE|nr:hypothetical protein PYW07_007882 [Mythimna separata]KAJ8723903.1 hypothetical protein PYW07_007883 [Mythimna separata]